MSQTNEPKLKRGFAVMTPEKRHEIASKGGRAITKKGKRYMRRLGSLGGTETHRRYSFVKRASAGKESK